MIDNAAFCPACGTRTAAPAVPYDPVHPEMPASEPYRDIPVQEERRELPAQDIPPIHSPADATVTPPAMPVPPANAVQERPTAQYRQTEAVYRAPSSAAEMQVPKAPKKKKEKEFFGVGAFVFCLIVIALLAGAAGMFAYKYFALLGVI